MNTRNNCYTYFKIVGNFNPDDVSELLGLTPEKHGKLEIFDVMEQSTILLFGKLEDALNMMSKSKTK